MKLLMILAVVCCVLPAVPTPALTAGTRDSMIVSVSWLASHLKDPNLVLLHVGTREGYDAGHIPGARYVAREDISQPPTDGALTLELPPVEALKSAFERLGVSDDSRVVVYFGDDWVSPTTRVYFTLDYIGLGDHTAILDGGMREWRAGDHPVTTEAPAVARGHLTPKPRPELVVDAEWVKAHIGQPRVAIVDARDQEFYAGATSGKDMRAGHIPSAKSVPYSTLVVEPRLTFVGADAMRRLLADAGVASGSTVVPYCHIGQQASVVYFAARYLGYDVRLYDGSFQDWSHRTELPVVTTGSTGGAKPDS